MAFKRIQGKTKFMWYPVTTSEVFTKGHLVIMTVGSNIVTEYDAGDDNSIAIGIIRHSIAATDSDYATARLVEIEVPVEKWVIWSCDDVNTGTAAAADVGTYADLDSAGAIDVDNSADDMFFITKVVTHSSTTGNADVRGVLNMGPECLGTIAD